MPAKAPPRRGAKWEALRQQVLKRDNHTCVYCGNEATEADHVVPRKLGGRDDLGNLVAACKPCNGRKGARVLQRTHYVNRTWLDRI